MATHGGITSSKRRQWRPDWGLWLALALCLLAVWPFLLRPGLPRQGDDTLLHVYRTAEYARMRQAGIAIPRWAANFYFGYGYPLFNYYAPASYALAGMLGGEDAVSGVKAVLVLSMLGAGAGMYHLARRWSGPRGGGVAALVYVYSPYLVWIDAQFRGAAPELMALGLAPWLFLAFDDLLTQSRPLDLAFAALALALLLLTHNLMAMLFAALLVGWLAWRIAGGWFSNRQDPKVRRGGSRAAPTGAQHGPNDRLVQRGPQRTAEKSARIHKTPGVLRVLAVHKAVLALGLGIGLAAYFWLPVLLERDAIRLTNVIGYDALEFRHNFRPFAELLAFSPVLDLRALKPPFIYNLGVATWGLGLVGLGAILRRTGGLGRILHRRARSERGDSDPLWAMLFFAVAAAVCLVFMHQATTPVWEAIPVLQFLQFPWRLLGPAVFGLAILAGGAALWLERLPVRGQTIGLTVLAALPVLLAFPTLMPPPPLGEIGPTDPLSVIESERSGGTVATTATDDFRPALVHIPPQPDEYLIASYAGDGPVDKINRAALPPDVTVEIVRHTPVEDVVRVDAPEPFNLVFNTFYWAGWQATIDGAPAGIEVPEPYGLIMTLVPAGAHEVRVFLADTPPRAIGQATSLLAALSLAVSVIAVQIRRRGAPLNAPRASSRMPLHAGRDALALAASGIVMLALAAVVLPQPGIAWLYSPPDTVQVAQYPHVRQMDGGITFLGFDLPVTEVQPGGTLEIVVYWQRTGPVAHDYLSFAHLISAETGLLWGQADKINPGEHPTHDWPPDRYVRDVYQVQVRPDAPSGEYELRAGLWDCEGVPEGECGPEQRLRVYSEDGEIEGDSVRLPVRVTVRP